MKKIINIGKVLLLTIIFVIGTANRCFADVYASPTEGLIFTIPILGVISAILGVLFVISLVCMLIAKIKNSEELLSKSKKICEILLYYILFVVGLIVAMCFLALFFILGIIHLVAEFVSLFLIINGTNIVVFPSL